MTIYATEYTFKLCSQNVRVIYLLYITHYLQFLLYFMITLKVVRSRVLQSLRSLD